MSARISAIAATGIMFLVIGIGTVATADVYYEVGPGQTYTTIQDALNATPFVDDGGGQWVKFTENHVINVHAGTYTKFETDWFSRLNGKLSRTTKTNRLIIQAVPGETVVINDTGYSQIRESHVTVQGIKFTGGTGADPNFYYIKGGTGGFAVANTQRGGIIVHNCEFDGGRGFAGYTHTSFDAEEAGVDFAFAFTDNYVHNFETHYEVPGSSLLPAARLGNLYEAWSNVGGTSIFRPNMATGYGSRWYVNNTLVSVSDPANLTGAVRVAAVDATGVTFANNIVSYAGSATQWGLYFDSAPADGQWPTMSNNIQDGATLAWARVAGVARNSLTDWNTYLSGHGAVETNSYDGDPLFADPVNGDFRLAMGSPGENAADPTFWTSAIADLGIGGLLSYYNLATDPGLQFGTPTALGAALVDVPEPTSVVVLALAGMLALYRRR